MAYLPKNKYEVLYTNGNQYKLSTTNNSGRISFCLPVPVSFNNFDKVSLKTSLATLQQSSRVLRLSGIFVNRVLRLPSLHLTPTTLITL